MHIDESSSTGELHGPVRPDRPAPSLVSRTTAIDVRLITPDGVEHRTPEELPALLEKSDTLVWVDIPSCDADAATLLRTVFGFHQRAIKDCRERNPLPKLHVYPDHVFLVLHYSEPGSGGHVHYIELDQFVGERFLVTVHGPVGAALNETASLTETRAIADRLESGRLHPGSADDLSYAISAALVTRLHSHLESLTSEVWRLERLVTAGHFGNAENFLEELFRSRHGLLAIQTMAALDHEVYGRVATLEVLAHDERAGYVTDLSDQFERVATVAEHQKSYLQGVIEFYRTRTDTKMTIAAERLAVIAAVTLPVTAVSSILGMNVITSDHTEWGPLVVLLVLMAVMSGVLLVWARRQGWW